MRSNANRRAWEDWGRVDPLYGILTDPRHRNGGDLEGFLHSGNGMVHLVMTELDRLGICARRGTALDFGCGIGRLTAPLARHFDDVIGVDISEPMLARARQLHAELPNCRFERVDDLSGLADKAFDLVLSLYVLQHLPTVDAIEATLAELVRLVAPGGALVVQLCSETPLHRPPLPHWRTRSGMRVRTATVLRRLAVPPGWLSRVLDWLPEMTMLALPDERARAVLQGADIRLVTVSGPEVDAGGTVHRTYFATRAAGR